LVASLRRPDRSPKGEVEAKVLSAGNRELLRVIAEKAPGSQAKALAELKGLGSKESEV
jgi:predicted transcriptional regulator